MTIRSGMAMTFMLWLRALNDRFKFFGFLNGKYGFELLLKRYVVLESSKKFKIRRDVV